MSSSPGNVSSFSFNSANAFHQQHMDEPVSTFRNSPGSSHGHNQSWLWKLNQESHSATPIHDEDWQQQFHFSPEYRLATLQQEEERNLSLSHADIPLMIGSDSEASQFSQLHSPSWSNSINASFTSGTNSPYSESANRLIEASSFGDKMEQDVEYDFDNKENHDNKAILSNTGANTQSVEKKRIQKRQTGSTCNNCRSKHIRCVYATNVDEKKEAQDTKRRCERCTEKNLNCARDYAPPSRRYPRPSRTGKRIEQARMIHGTLPGGSISPIWQNRLTPQMLLHGRPELFSNAASCNNQLTNKVMGGSVSLRLLTCFFATAHMQMPIVDFHNFSARYNFSQGDCRIMAIMANGGDASGIPSAKQSAPGLSSTGWPCNVASKTSQKSTLATAGSSEALITVMHAWAALYTDLPIAFGPAPFSLNFKTEVTGEERETKVQSHVQPTPSTQQPSTISSKLVMGSNGKWRRPKRKQGVACDSCKLRRLRCDKLERPEGMGCSRCEDKSIVCTDEYIQSKRKKTEPRKGGKEDVTAREEEEEEKEEGLVGSAPSLSRDVTTILNGKQKEASSRQQDSWLEEGFRLPGGYSFGRGREALIFGKARQPFFQALLLKSINLVEKHSLQREPSVEGIQVLMLLAMLMDLAGRRDGDTFARSAAAHITTLGLESNYEVDESDRKGIESILGHMQMRRLWYCVWTRDAIVSGLHRKKPHFEAERALGIKGKQSGRSSQANPGKGTSHNTSEIGINGSSNNNSELNGEMGLSFSILALMQVGALSRFMAKHIDNTDRITVSEYSDAVPSFVNLQKVTRACHALWKSIDSLLLFFDQCSLTARNNMDNLQPFQPLGWIATIKIAGAMLELATFRTLAERLQQASIHFHMSRDSITLEDQLQVQNLKELLESSRRRTLISCRRIAKLVEFLLAKNVFQTGGILLRQLLPVTHFLAKMPPVNRPLDTMSIEEPQQHQQMELYNAMFQNNSPSHHSIDPKALLNHSLNSGSNTSQGDSTKQRQEEDKEEEEESKEGHIPESIFTGQLEPFDAIRKRREVEFCLEALAQMGYAWPTIGDEIASIEEIMKSQS